jgi:pimeloyl-ACP methyl ester carboxylesterase
MPARIKQSFILSAAVAAILLLSLAGAAYAQAGVTTITGALPDGAAYLIEVPANWNGTLLLYSHGYVVPGSPNPAQDIGDPLTRFFVLSNGFAIAGSSYATTGWAIQQALPDQIAVLDAFTSQFGQPTRTIAWGHSLGGMITAGLIQRFPSRFDAALPMCGVLAGGLATWNQALDSQFAFNVFFGQGTGLQIVNITNPAANLGLSEFLLAAAQSTPQGQARLALSTALAETPGWFNPALPEPAPTDFASQEANQFLWSSQVDFPFVFAFRAELEARAGGNPSTNVGVDYHKQFNRSVDRDEVRALYQQAGLNLDDDLELLNNSARVAANPASVAYLDQNISFNGRIGIPVLTMHTKGDGLVVVEDEQAYAQTVRQAGRQSLLRETFVHRAGHCAFTPAETIAVLQVLLNRLDTGRWQGTGPDDLNNAAAALGSTLNVAPPSFFQFQPPPFLRPSSKNGDH